MKKLTAIVIIGASLVILVSFFFGLSILNKQSGGDPFENTNSSSEPPTEPITTQLVIAHAGQTVEVALFDVRLTMPQHTLQSTTTVVTTVVLHNTDNTVLGEMHFTQIGEVQQVHDYSVRLVHATAEAAQFIISTYATR